MGKLFRQIHIELSLFFLPLALLYAITGALYLSGFNQDSGAKKWKFSLPQMHREELPKAVDDLLLKNGLSPIKDTELKQGRGNSFMLGGAAYSASLTEDANGWRVNVTKRGFWGNMIMLHKGKVEWYFNVLAYAFAASLLALYFSGLMMTKFCKNRRKRALLVVALGFIVSGVLAYVSL